MTSDIMDQELTELDFVIEIPCEHSEHEDDHAGDEPASFYVRSSCVKPGCSYINYYFLCRPGWVGLANSTVECNDCGHHSTRNECMKIIDIVRGY